MTLISNVPNNTIKFNEKPIVCYAGPPETLKAPEYCYGYPPVTNEKPRFYHPDPNQPIETVDKPRIHHPDPGQPFGKPRFYHPNPDQPFGEPRFYHPNTDQNDTTFQIQEMFNNFKDLFNLNPKPNSSDTNFYC